ncbi:MAG: pseudouridine synthase [Candidatus Nomurabacteria bacterium]|jgi:23S rRNA pseudouridine2605 synthase|nr:pseudouridine synthase [Candidatus Nomurabacteria bacterium]
MTRLNKFLAEKTGISRREADDLIAAGRVETGGKTAILGQKIAENAAICVDGKPVSTEVKHKTILLNKPIGYLSSRRSQGGDPTVYDLLPTEYKKLKTAGRLDKDSSGLIILSSDGDLIQNLTHPRHQKTKIYEIALNKPLKPEHQRIISGSGVNLPDGKSRLKLAKSSDPDRAVRVTQRRGTPEQCFPSSEKFSGEESVAGPEHPEDELGFADATKHWQITMQEGRNRQIRRTFAALGYTVKKLHRTHLGPYSLGKLKTGKFVVLDSGSSPE